ncbi:hypothetical protein ACQ5SP_03620 [Rhodovulum sp. YNF3179]|uniref:hypothetical protein n=1 Tax=Rhodovulum sp. YNF3179 TaxID=3425127 RepID=UPI003D32D55E
MQTAKPGFLASRVAEDAFGALPNLIVAGGLALGAAALFIQMNGRPADMPPVAEPPQMVRQVTTPAPVAARPSLPERRRDVLRQLLAAPVAAR